MHLRLIEKQEQRKPQISRWREITKIRDKSNEIETKQTMLRINESKSWFFRTINEIKRPLPNMTKWWREKTHINKIRDEKGVITTNIKKIQKIINEYFENLYSSKLENLDEMDKSLDACNQPKLNQEDINYINSPIICNEIETIIESPYKEEPRT
jgi:hypothetical protein